MPKTEPKPLQLPRMGNLSREERKSLTHSDFWIPEAEREVYKRALAALNEAGIPYVVAGAYAIYEHTGIYRQTKDLDVFCEPEAVIPAMRALKEAGFLSRLEQQHWVAKAISRENRDHFVDIIFGMGNGLALIDRDWFDNATPAILAATPVRVAPPEDLIWHRLFINERHRHDMADIAHLILCKGALMDWRRLLGRTADHWPLLLSQLLLFRYVYPGYHEQVPRWVLEELLERARTDLRDDTTAEDRELTRGTVISRFSFAIDVNEWGFHDLREEMTQRMEGAPLIREIAASDVWDERGQAEASVPAAAPGAQEEEP